MDELSSSELRRRLFGKDLSVADGHFPDDLKDKLTTVESSFTEFTEGEYWHLDRLWTKVSNYRKWMPVVMILLVLTWIAGFVILHFGFIQTGVFIAVLYWVVGLWLKAGAVKRLLDPVMAHRESE